MLDNTLKDSSVLAAAIKYVEDGLAPIPVPSGSKAPIIPNWTQLNLMKEQIPQYFKEQLNIGIRLGHLSGGLIDIDFDLALAKRFAFLLPNTPMCHGRDGNIQSHYFYRSSEPIKTKRFEDSEGVILELRSTGCQTIVPPSIHPSGEKLFWHSYGPPSLVDANTITTAVQLIAASVVLAKNWPSKGNRNSAALAWAGCLARAGIDQDEATKLVIETAKAAGDEEYLERGKCVGSTYMKLADGEQVTGIPKLASLIGNEASTKIADWLNIKTNPDEHVIELMNKRHAVVNIGGTTCILTEVFDPSSGQMDVTFCSTGSLALQYANKVIKANDKLITYSDLWLSHPKRQEYVGVEFAPKNPTNGFYNLFRGFPITPVEGDISLYLEHIHENICSANPAIFDYVINWMAHAIQKPEELPETALVLREAQGTGKGVFVNHFGSLFGCHFLTLYRISQITGRFNGHLKNVILLHANEAIWGGNKEAEGALKGLITDPTIPIEHKGKDITQVRNYKRLIASSNENWAVPIDLDDRRFAVIDVMASHKEDHKYFAAIEQQMLSGGRAALMHFLTTRDISKFNVRKLPLTSMSIDMKMRSANTVVQWWYHQLVNDEDSCISWDGNQPKKIAYEDYLTWCNVQKKPHPEINSVFCKELCKIAPSIKSHKPYVIEFGGKVRKPCFKFPSLKVCRKDFEQLVKGGNDLWD